MKASSGTVRGGVAVAGRRRPRSRSIVLSVLLLAGCAPSPSPTPPPSSPGPATTTAGPSTGPVVTTALADRLATTLDAGLRDAGPPGAQAAIVFADGSIWTGAAGISTADRPMNPELLIAIGSVTKVYTAALILGLADEGSLSLDDPLTRWVPDAANADRVTIRQLLLHTSGIASDDPALEPVCPPGTCLSYSNSGYGYLGAVIERASGTDYAHALHARILTPLGLEATFFPGQEAMAGEQATGHLGDEEALADDAATVAGAPQTRGAAGGIVATAADTARFAHALFAGALVSDSSRGAMVDFEATHGLPGTDDCAAEAMVYRRGGEFGESWNHGGNTGYFRSWVEHYPRYGVTIVVSVNSNTVPIALVDQLAGTALADAPVIADSRDRGGRCETVIAVRDADGTVRAVTTPRGVGGVDGLPSWSPDGKSLAWIGYHDGRNDVYVGDALGSRVVRLTDDPAQDVGASWSPDGSTIAFSSDRDGDREIYLMATDGSNVRQLTRNDVDDLIPAWSPDGSMIAYVRAGDDQQLRVMAADGQDDRRIDGPVDDPWWPTWSPDGSRIAYESGGVIFIVPVAGGETVRLPIPQIRVTRFPAWAPGTNIAFVSDGDLYAAAEDGSNLRRLTETSTMETTPAWSPDGSSLAFGLSSWVEASRR